MQNIKEEKKVKILIPLLIPPFQRKSTSTKSAILLFDAFHLKNIQLNFVDFNVSYNLGVVGK